ncbi:MAG: adenine phosphoribosyltransferase [Chloroflexi bacterium]|nr:adenine phosphoribosyltransferase [Chloroflexota bacterium]
MDLLNYIREVPDFPKKGIGFKDITPLLGNADAFKYVIDRFARDYEGKGIEAVVGVESRGFIFGAPLAYTMRVPFVPIRKPGKLPAACVKIVYDLEYGTDAIEMHKDALVKGQKVLIVDDLLATGGTSRATVDLVEKVGGKVMGLAFVIELAFLKGRLKLQNYKVNSLIQY